MSVFSIESGAGYVLRRMLWMLLAASGALPAWGQPTPGPPRGPQPANDNFENAIEITGPIVQLTWWNNDATRQSQEPSHGATNGASASVWWRWIAPASGPVEVDTEDSSFNTLLGVYIGTAVNAMTQLAADNDSGTGNRSALRFNAVAGTEYRIAVDGVSGATGNITLRLGPSPANDLFSDAILLTETPAVAGASNERALKETGEPNHAGNTGGRSLWWRWTAPTNGLIEVNTEGSNFDTVLAVYTGAAVDALALVASDNSSGSGSLSSLRFEAVGGTEYWIAVDGAGGAQGNVSLHLGSPQTNDQFAHATGITGLSVHLATANDRASKEAGEPVHAGNAGGRSLWWRWTAPASGVVTMHTEGSAISALLAVYTGTALDGLTTIAFSGNHGGSDQGTVQFPAVGGMEYWIAVDGRNGVGGNLALHILPPPANDLQANAVVFSGASVEVDGTSDGASRETGEASHSGSFGGHSVWWQWTAPAGGRVLVHTIGSQVATALAIYPTSGASIASAIGSSPGSGNSLVSFEATAGTAYWIAVDSVTAGPIKLTLTMEEVAPVFVRMPADAAVITPATVTFSASTYGNPVSTYQWQRKAAGQSEWTNLTVGNGFSGVTGPTLTVTSAADRNGDQFRLMASNSAGQAFSDPVTLTVNVPPANNDFAHATILPSTLLLTVAGTSAFASKQPGESSFPGSTPGASVWWRWTAPTGGVVALNTAGSDYDTTLAVSTGPGLGELTKVAANDNTSDRSSALSFNATAGTTYHLGVAGVGAATGNIVLNLSEVPSLPNDLFSGARVLTGVFASDGGDNAAAWAEPGEPSHAGSGPARSLWWRWTAPADSSVQVSTGGTLASALAVYTGEAVNALTLVAANHNFAGKTYSLVTFNATAGTTYHIAVDGALGGTDSFVLSLSASDVTPVIAQQPANVTAPIQGTAQFALIASGNPPPNYQWQRRAAGTGDWVALADGPGLTGAASATLQLSGLTLAMKNDDFRCIVSNAGGSISSETARLTVRSVSRPFITTHPASTLIGVPGAAVLTVVDTASPAPTYRWQRTHTNSVAWADFTSTSQPALPLTDPGDFGYQYRVIVENEDGSAISRPATVGLRQAIGIFPKLTADTKLFIWGTLGSTELSPQDLSPEVTGLVAVAAGRSHVLGLKADGTVVGWGDPFGGSIPVPADMGTPGADVVSLSSWYGTFAQRADGSARAWETGSPVAPTTGGDLLTVMSWGYRLGIFVDGDVMQNGPGPKGFPGASLGKTIAVAGSFAYGFALLGDGNVTGWNNTAPANISPAGFTGVVALAVSDGNALGLKSDGTVVQWGGTTTIPAPPAGLADVVAIAAGYHHFLALRKDGTVAAWGEDTLLADYSQSKNHIIAISGGVWNTAVLQKNTWDVPVIVSHPASRALDNGQSTLLYVGAVGPGTLTYQWYKDSLDNPIAGATVPAYQTAAISTPTVYFARVTNSFGAATTVPTVILPSNPLPPQPTVPSVQTQPASQTVGYHQTTGLTVAGTPNGLTYQWFQGARGDTSTPVGANSANFTTPLLTENATYWVRASNAAGSANSQAAQLTVLSPSATWVAALGLSGPDLAPEATPFADGLPNLLRYALNLGATPAPGQLPGGSYETVGGVTYFKLQFRQRKNLSGVALVTQFSNNLSTWQDVPAESLTQLPDDDAATERWEVRLPVPPGGRIFLRLRATED